MKSVLLCMLCMVGATATSCAPSGRPVIFVAASLADVAASWQVAYPGGFEYHSGASHLLANQIAAGAHADLFLAAGSSALTKLSKAGWLAMVDSSYLRNRLVLVCAQGVAPPVRPEELRDPRFARIAMADPGLAPAGEYTRTGLQKAGIWESLRPRLILTGDTRMAAEAVRLAAADAAFVYATDAAKQGGVTVTALDSLLFPEVRYPLAMLAPRSPAKDSLWAFLHSSPALQTAVAQGFH